MNDDATLVRNAIANARARRPVAMPLWAVVRDMFAIGSTSAYELCRRFSFDPEQEITRTAGPKRAQEPA